MEVSRIRKIGGNWHALETPMEVQPTLNVLDSANSGRNNSTGMMFRDIVAEKTEYKFTVPYGMTSAEGAIVFDILKGDSFEADVPDILTSNYSVKRFYNAKVSPSIARVKSRTSWIYNEFDISATEM